LTQVALWRSDWHDKYGKYAFHQTTRWEKNTKSSMAAGEPSVDSPVAPAASPSDKRSLGKGAGQDKDDKQPSYLFHVEECNGGAEVSRTPQCTIVQPFFLRRSTLLVVSTIFLAEVVALIALVAYSTRNDGLLPVRPALHQLWKYGPTASSYPLRFSHPAKQSSRNGGI
jgi:hypothetical protein